MIRLLTGQLTLMLHKSVYLFKRGQCKPVAFTRPMLVGAAIPHSGDARYWMLAIQECTENEIKQHPVSSLPGRISERAKAGNQYPGSINIATDFRRDDLSPMHILCNYSVYTRPYNK